MSTILIIGTGPLYSPEAKVFSGQSLRTWHITKPLRDAGHAIDLIVIPTDGYEISSSEPTTTVRYDTFNYTLINSHSPDQVLPVLQSAVDQKKFDAIIAVNVNAAAIAARLSTKVPMWADLMGHVMGEAQTKSSTYDDDSYVQHFWQRERLVLRRADRFSVSSHKQMYALLGELGTTGRLGKQTCAHPFVSVIPIGAAEQFLNMDLQFAERQFRGPVFPEDTFAVLWTGGYNTWTDVKTLAAALSLAMEQIPRMRFISTGGAIPGHDEISYPAFIEEMQRTGFADRCHFLGWIEGQQLPNLYAECDLGLNLDGLNYETLFGGRIRLTNMMAAGVPVLTTLGTELSEVIAEARLGYTVKIGKVQEFADTIHRAFRNPLERRQLAQRAKNYCRENFTYEATTRGLARWAADPALAPDNLEKVRTNPGVKRPADVALNPLERESAFLESGGLAEVERLKSELAQLKGSGFFKLREKVHSLKSRKKLFTD
ncbi:MAG: glycosyltransferase [Candidatus Sumerlaeaceae bacterium]